MLTTRTCSTARGDAFEVSACLEWRRLCFVLEGLQATALLLGRCDKYELARTYLAYQLDHDRTVSDIQRAIERGDFRFFTDRGVPSSIASPVVARELLRDWRGAIASKLERIAQAFAVRFDEVLPEFIATPANAARIAAAAGQDERNAVALLDRWFVASE
jgi:hypothetical protein